MLTQPQDEDIGMQTMLRYSVGQADVLGVQMAVQYRFEGNVWTAVPCEAVFADEDAALEFAQECIARFSGLYGEPGWEEENNGDTLGDMNADENDKIEMTVGNETKVVPVPDVLTSNMEVLCCAQDGESVVSLCASLNCFRQESSCYEEMGDFYTEWLEQSAGETGLLPEYHDERYYGK